MGSRLRRLLVLAAAGCASSLAAACGHAYGTAESDASVSDAATVESSVADAGPDGTTGCTGPFGGAQPVLIAGIGEVRSYRPWLEGRVAFGVSTSPQIFAVNTDMNGAPTSLRTTDVTPSSGLLSTGHPMATADGLGLFVQAALSAGGKLRVLTLTRSTPDGSFGAPTDVPARIGDQTLEPWILPDARTLYFRGIGGAGAVDFYVMRRASTSTDWGTPVVLAELQKATVNGYPVVTADDRVIYFASASGAGGNEGVWTSTRAKASDPWGEPTKVSINSEGDDRPTWISPDGCTLYITSDRAQSGRFSLYRAVRGP